jgi:DNA-binding NarL/FixJ family response regulator
MLVVSMHDEDLYAQRSLAAGAMGYVNKEQPVAETLAAIRQVLAGRIYLSEQAKERLVESVAGAAQRPTQDLSRLSDRELEVFSLMGQGLSTRAIADQLAVSVKTVETHRERIKEKLGVTSLYELIRRAVAWNLDPGTGAAARGSGG